MNNTIRYAEETEVQCTNNDRVVTAECDDFRVEESINVFIAHNKIPMRWNGKVYVGNMAGLEFTTLGPKETSNKYNRF